MNRHYISGSLGVVVVLAFIVGLTGTAVALPPIQGVYDPMNPLEFMLACCQWELMKKIELTLLGQAPDERVYTPALAALDYIPPGWELGRPPSSSPQAQDPQVQGYDASLSCCGHYGQAQAQADMDIMWVGAQYQAWKASQDANTQASNAGETTSDINYEEIALSIEQLLTTNETKINVQQTQAPLAPLVAYASDTDAGNDVLKVSEQSADEKQSTNKKQKQSADEEICEACAEAQQFAEWLFSQPKPITT